MNDIIKSRRTSKKKVIEDVQKHLFAAQIMGNKESEKLIEKFLIQLLGHQEI
jgi:hypothetical protein